MRGIDWGRSRTRRNRVTVALLVPPVGPASDLMRTTVLRANALIQDHEVEVVGVGRAVPRPADLEPDIDFRTLEGAATDAGLAALSADILVTSTAGLLAKASLLCRRDAALIHLETTVLGETEAETLAAFASRADAIVTPTASGQDRLRDLLGPVASRVRLLPSPAPSAPRSALERPVVLAVGRADGTRQHDHAVRAFGRVADQLPGWRLRLIGSGPGRGRLQAIADRERFGDRIELADTVRMDAELSAASIGLLTSRSEGDQLALLHAMSAGLPVIAYDCPTVPSEVLTHGVDGYLTPQGDEAAVAERLLLLARDADLRARVGEAALATTRRFAPASFEAGWREIVSEARASRRLSPAVATKEPGPMLDIRPPTVTPQQFRADLLSVVVREFAVIDGWFVLPGRDGQPPTVVVPDDQRASAIEALGRAGLPDTVSLAITESDGWQVGRGAVAAMCRSLPRMMVRGLSLEPWPDVEGARSHLCDGSGLRAEFWLRDHDGVLHAPGPNPFVRRVRPDHVGTISVEGVTAPGLSVLAGPYYDECRFPIDAVFTWVDDGDPDWHSAKSRALSAAPQGAGNDASSGDARFRNRDELRYSLRSLHTFAPWIRTIHLVTAGQRPSWLVDHPQVRLVDHSEILPADALPTFNSHAIETALHRIEGLSEHFLYFNDDFFLGRPLTPEAFFTAGGLPKVFTAPGPIGVPGSDDPPFEGAAALNRALLHERFGATITQHLLHIPYPLTRSLLGEAVHTFPTQVERTARARFRSSTDVSLVSSLAPHFGMLAGTAVESLLPTRFVDASRPNLPGVLSDLLDRELHTFCIGDHHAYALPHDEVDRLLAGFFDQYFPVRAPWEREPTS